MDPDFIPPMTGPNIEDIRTVDGGYFRRITYPDGRVETVPMGSSFVYSNPIFTGESRMWSAEAATRSWSMNDYGEFRKYFESEEYKDVDIVRKQSHKAGEHIVACSNEKDLSVENILRTLSAIKGKLMVDVAPIHLQKIECAMTPLVRRTVVEASKKLKRYGKKRPIVARFDEFGNRLPDEIDLGTANGITLKIIDPEDYGPNYLELKGIEFPKMEPNLINDFKDTYIDSIDPDDLPF